MKYVSVVVLVFGLCVSAAGAQNTPEDLLNDLVSHVDGKMVIEQFSVDRIEIPGYDPVQFQVRYYSEAPDSAVISRDQFVALSGIISFEVLQLAFAEAYNVSVLDFINAWESEDIDEAIGTPDLEISIIMNRSGMQMELSNTASGQKNRWTETWEQFFSEE